MEHPGLSTTVKIPGELASRLEAEIERLKVEQPGVGWDRSKIIRMALERYLRAVEGLPAAFGSAL